jgi:ectoine hydroxylase-related dioxygenase (phytanoyl-CoA dioxygenase family)
MVADAPPVRETGFPTEEQRRRFERDGILVVEDALSPERVARLVAAVDRVYEQALRDGTGPHEHWNIRNCIAADPLFLDLVDQPNILPLVVGLLNWNIHLITSHLIVRPPSPPDTDRSWKATGWHRDGGTSASEMEEPHPRLFLKVCYCLTDTTAPDCGATRVVPGSHRLIGRPAQAEGEPDPYGAIELRVKAGTAFFFEQRVWHAVGPNYSDQTRKSLFYGYGYRWLRPMDYVTMAPELLAQCDPIRRQLLGDAQTQLGYWLPKDEDVPLRAWAAERETPSPPRTGD